jgi:spermidine synthase
VREAQRPSVTAARHEGHVDSAGTGGQAEPVNRRGTPDPEAGTWTVSTGTAALVPDGDGRRGWTLMINGVPSSHVDLDDPLRLDFEYMRWIADVIETAEPDGPLRVLHLGGAGCTLARWVAATRPLSRQLVVELDADIVDLARRAFGLRSTGLLRVRAGDARQVLGELPDERYEIVVRDAFAIDQVPAHLTTREFLTQVRRVLASGPGGPGLYLANMGDQTPALDWARAEAATALSVFGHVVLIAEPAQFHGRRYGNLLLVASDRALPPDGLPRRLASGAVRARMLEGGEVRSFAAGRRPLEDGVRS